MRRAVPLLLLLAAAALAADPPEYRRLDSWQATLLAAREAQILARTTGQALPGFHPFVSPVLRGGQPALHVVVDIASLDRLWLIATVGGDNYNFDQAIWGEPKLIDADGTATPLSSVKPTSANVGWGTLLVDNNHTNQGLRVGGTTFAKGFWAHAPSQLRFDLPHRYARFEAWVGVDMAAGGNGSVSFKVMDEADTTDTAPTLWLLLARDFTRAAEQREMGWEREDGLWEADWQLGDLQALAARYAAACRRVPGLQPVAEQLAAGVTAPAGLAAVRQVYYRSRRLAALLPRLGALPAEPLRRAIADLATTFGGRYPHGAAYLARLDAIAAAAPAAAEAAKSGATDAMDAAVKLVESFDALQREALLANPLLDFDRLLLVRRRANQLGLPQNWQSNSTLPRNGFDNAIVSLAWRDPDSVYQTVYQPPDGHFAGDVDLHWNADRLLFSSLDEQSRWQVFEIRPDGTGLRQVTPGDQPAVDNYDACYLPNGNLLFNSTAPFVGVPCVFGSDHVAMLFRCDAIGQHVRQLCFEQDHDWCPTVLNNGRVLYTRWEYADTPHSQTRLLFHMNPDGTEQMEYMKSNSYWPNGFFYARPIPGHPTEVAAVISGHHGVPRMGELVLFDPAKGRYEADGAVQRIPGYGQKVEPLIRDALVDGSWPKFLHPYPLSDTYFLVSMQPDAQSPWGLYLVDRFDNLLCLRAEPEWALLEPLPLRRIPVPPVIPDKVDPRRRDALVYLENIYAGPGLAGVPRGAVKRLRVLSYEFAYHNMGGLLGVLGMEGPWDIKRILGTVPVNDDGSAFFRVPANTPLSVQPLDAEGKALQLMRSWMTAMPGETLSCVGCHDRQSSSPRNGGSLALRRAPDRIQPWYGPARGFSYPREVQPVIDRYCIKCHDGGGASDLRGTELIKDFHQVTPGTGDQAGGRFSVGYAELHRYVRRPGIESDLHLLSPLEFHADTTDLVQLLKQGHHGVQLDPESWDRLITWIDLNTVYHGTWTDAGHNPGPQRERRRELGKLYANLDDDPEAEAGGPAATLQTAAVPVRPPLPPGEGGGEGVRLVGTVAATGEAVQLVASGDPHPSPLPGGEGASRKLDLGGGVTLELARILAGEFVMGDPAAADARPAGAVRIDQPFWMGTLEVTNAQYARFDPRHDSRVEDKLTYQFGVHGYPENGPEQPVVRLTWREATAFCAWLSRLTGARVMLPTEAQWEWACRAGTTTPFWWGGLDDDFAPFANLGDAKLRELASNPYTLTEPLPDATKYDDWVPKETRFNDGALVTVNGGSFRPNPWALFDMHGNAAEWTRTTYRPYPYREDDGRNDLDPELPKVVRGGSWRDRPFRSTAGYRLAYRTYQPVYNVGFRVVVEP